MHPAFAAPQGPRPGYRGPLVAGGRGSVFVGGRPVAFVRGPRVVNWLGGPRRLVGLTLIPALVIGGVSLYPYAYLPVDQPYCGGYTEDGCQLQWQDVPTEDGYAVPQCVAYCPYQ